MKVFAISDLHLSTSVEKPMNIFGDGWTNHFEKISADWREKVKDDDLVLLGGDMSWGMTIDEATPDYALVSALSGRKIVGKGNHDYYWNSLSKIKASFAGFEFLQNNAFRVLKSGIISDSIQIRTNDNSTDSIDNGSHQNSDSNSPSNRVSNALNCDYSNDNEAEIQHSELQSTTANSTDVDSDMEEKGVVIAGTRGWTIPTKDTPEADIKIYKRELIRLELSLQKAQKLRKDGDILIVMLHYPPFDADYADTEMTALIEKYHADFVLYGHLHGKNVRVNRCLTKHDTRYLLTSCDLIDNKLIEVCEI